MVEQHIVSGLVIALIFLIGVAGYQSKKVDRLQAKLDKYKDFNEMFAVRETEMIKIFCEQVIGEKLNDR